MRIPCKEEVVYKNYKIHYAFSDISGLTKMCKVMPFRKLQLSNLFMQMLNVVS